MKHITLKQRLAIKKCQKEKMTSLDASKLLDIDHRTVKLWYGRNVNESQSKSTSTFRKVVLEAVRLLAWPTPRALGAVRHYSPLIEQSGKKVNKRRPLLEYTGKTQLEAETIEQLRQEDRRRMVTALNKDYQRFLNSNHATVNVRKRWDLGNWAVHAVRLKWYQHDEKDDWVKHSISPDVSRPIEGWLLILVDRSSVTAKNRQKWELKFCFNILTGKNLDKSYSSKIISNFVNNNADKLKSLWLVTAGEGVPTATFDKNVMMKMVNETVQIESDKPTSGGSVFTISLSFPNPRALENYLAVVLDYPGDLPAHGTDWWRDLGRKVTDEDFVSEQLGGKSWFLSR